MARRRFSDEYMSIQRALYPEIKTERGILDKAYQNRAVGILLSAGIDKFSFLFDVNTDTVNSGILRELGKIEDDNIVLLIAEHICEKAKTEKHTVRKWAAYAKYCKFCFEKRPTEGQKCLYVLRHELEEFAISETVSEKAI